MMWFVVNLRNKIKELRWRDAPILNEFRMAEQKIVKAILLEVYEQEINFSRMIKGNVLH